MTAAATLLPVAPVPHVLGVLDLAERWGVSKRALQRWIDSPDFPQAGEVGRDPDAPPAPPEDDARKARRVLIWAMADIAAWEDARREAGLPLPGERPRGYRTGEGPSVDDQAGRE